MEMRSQVANDCRQVLSSILTIVFLIAASAPIVFQEKASGGSCFLGPIQLKKFTSYAELENFVGTDPVTVVYRPDHKNVVLRNWGSKGAMSAFEVSYESDYVGYMIGYYNGPDYSTTNVQVHGVDEADIVKTDGKYLYVVSVGRVFILIAHPPEEARVLSEIEIDTSPLGIFVNGDRLVVFESGRRSNFKPKMRGSYWRRPSETTIKVYDISDRSSPVLLNEIILSGTYFNSRMIGNHVYAVVNTPLEYADDKIRLPSVSSHGKKETISALEIYYFENLRPPYVFTIITAIDIRNAKETANKVFLMNATQNMYVSFANLYVSYPDMGKTVIHKISIADGEITYKARGEVPGHLLNQFSLGEHRGYLRVATTTSWMSYNNVYVLDGSLNIVGRLEELAPGERIYSARFMGDRAYLVTFKKVDPLFVVDLKDPSEPKVLGYLKIPGYSDYLHPYDETHLIGVGKDTYDMGSFAWYQGVKIALFDVSDPENPKELAKFVAGDRGTDSEVLRDHKAFLFSKSKNLLVIPISLAEVDDGLPPSVFGRLVWQGAYVFHISSEDGLVLKGKVAHERNVRRSLYIDDVLYTISDGLVKMNDLEDLSEINAVELDN